MADDLIAGEENLIRNLQAEARATRLPARTISWQINNSSQVRNIPQRIRVVRKQRAQINNRIFESTQRVKSLRESILGI
jgi:hypothetical protein